MSLRRSLGCCLVASGVLLLLGCNPGAGPSPSPSVTETPSVTVTPSVTGTPSPSASASPTPSPTLTPSPSPTPTPSPTATESLDPRNRFYTKDKTAYASPWFEGRHRLMIDFGCVDAPYYSPDPRCEDGAGFHHGIDVAMPCGTPIKAGRGGTVVSPGAPGSLGDAYGSTGFRLRTANGKRDIVIGHAKRVLVEPGDRVKKGQRIALAGARGAPDGCHLHFEVRAADGSLDSARDPRPQLDLKR